MMLMLMLKNVVRIVGDLDRAAWSTQTGHITQSGEEGQVLTSPVGSRELKCFSRSWSLILCQRIHWANGQHRQPGQGSREDPRQVILALQSRASE